VEFDPVKIEGAVADDCGDARDIFAMKWKIFDVYLTADGQIGDGEQAHADIADIDTKSIHRSRAGEYTHGRVEELALIAAPVWFESTSEKHGESGEYKLAQRGGRTKITKVRGRRRAVEHWRWQRRKVHLLSFGDSARCPIGGILRDNC
jgi:hypothetical protein